jgi:penicillin-binding protein 1A
MGAGATGGGAALPIWVDFMQVALEDLPTYNRPIPPGLVTSKIDLKTGKLATANNPDTRLEYFIAEYLPEEENAHNQATDIDEDIIEDIF